MFWHHELVETASQLVDWDLGHDGSLTALSPWFVEGGRVRTVVARAMPAEDAAMWTRSIGDELLFPQSLALDAQESPNFVLSQRAASIWAHMRSVAAGTVRVCVALRPIESMGHTCDGRDRSLTLGDAT